MYLLVNIDRHSISTCAAKGASIIISTEFEIPSDFMLGLCCTGIFAAGGALVDLIKSATKEKFQINGKLTLYQFNRNRIDSYAIVSYPL